LQRFAKQEKAESLKFQPISEGEISARLEKLQADLPSAEEVEVHQSRFPTVLNLDVRVVSLRKGKNMIYRKPH
jgi:hypothetical protein